MTNAELRRYYAERSVELPCNVERAMSLGRVESELTFGERAVGLTFNPSGDDAVREMKEQIAAFIDNCHERREVTDNPEIKRMYSIAITEAQTAQMWSVKAATWRG